MNDPEWWVKDPRWDWTLKDTKALLEKKQWMLESAQLQINALEAKSNWYEKRIISLKLALDNDVPAIQELHERIDKLHNLIKGKLLGQEGIDALNREILKLEGAIKYFEQEIEIVKNALWTVKEAVPRLSLLIGPAIYNCKHVAVKEYKSDGYNRGMFIWDEFDHYFYEEYGKYGKVPVIEKKQVVEVSLADYYSAWWKNDMKEDPFRCNDFSRNKSYWGTVSRKGGNSIWVRF